ncbi:MAG TPA: CoA-binding protein [Limnochordia bacterium]|nr:CoA-binding protein [Limnochordia bacterium]
MPSEPTPADFDAIFAQTRTIAVVGLSPDPDRSSHGVASYLQQAGYRIIPVNPNARAVLGERAYPDLRSVPEPVDLVDVFRRSEFVPEIAEETVAISAKALWLQLGVVHEPAARRARAAGLTVVMDRCLAVEHRFWLARRANG